MCQHWLILDDFDGLKPLRLSQLSIFFDCRHQTELEHEMDLVAANQLFALFVRSSISVFQVYRSLDVLGATSTNNKDVVEIFIQFLCKMEEFLIISDSFQILTYINAAEGSKYFRLNSMLIDARQCRDTVINR